MKKVIFSLVLGLGMLSNAQAAGDAQAGQTKAAMCGACHGSNGIGTSDMYPNLAGQHADYIVKQLKAFKGGSRSNAMMAPMAAGLSEQDMADVAAYFSGLSRTGESASSDSAGSAPTAAASAPAYQADPAKGKSLYEHGDDSRGITACVACHGKEGASNVAINPNLAAQHPEYIEKQLKNFKEHTRNNASMNQVAGNLTNNDIADIGAYFKDPKAVANVIAKKPAAAKSFSGDIAAGKLKAATCTACHGADGNAMVPMYPKLAGQHEKYLVKQLTDFKKAVDSQGKEGRADPVMGGMVATLSADDIQNLAAYFASQQVSASTAKANDLGKKLYFSGDLTRGITACVGCHSAEGNGMGQAGFPSVAKQNVDYLKGQLTKFRQKDRTNDLNGMMQNIAGKLSDDEIQALAEFMSSL